MPLATWRADWLLMIGLRLKGAKGERDQFSFWDAQPCSLDLEGRQWDNVDCGFDQCVPWAESLRVLCWAYGSVLVLGILECVCLH